MRQTIPLASLVDTVRRGGAHPTAHCFRLRPPLRLAAAAHVQAAPFVLRCDLFFRFRYARKRRLAAGSRFPAFSSSLSGFLRRSEGSSDVREMERATAASGAPEEDGGNDSNTSTGGEEGDRNAEEPVVSLAEVLAESEELENEARAVLGGSDHERCSYSQVRDLGGPG